MLPSTQCLMPARAAASACHTLPPTKVACSAWCVLVASVGSSFAAGVASCCCVYRYPQLIQNYLLKSVAGISFDFMIYNWLGFFCYSTFNLGLYLHPMIRAEYRYRSSQLP